jgi:wyosine [tRNA(Phe)-imidazoG37] synthetase (radical SAM superfamily)
MSAAHKIDDSLPTGYVDSPKSEGGLIYGPFLNGPFGKNLGINLLGSGAKACSFDCPYCDLGTTNLRLNRLKIDAKIPSVEEVEHAIHNAFKKIHSVGPIIDGICLSGNGEPTLHPEFDHLVSVVLAARDTWMPGKPVSLFTNAASLDQRKIYEAANRVSERVVKIDAGNENLFKTIAAPLSRSNLARILTGTRKLKDVIVQSMFFDGVISNVQPVDIDDWLEVIAMVKPKAVHIYGLTRAPAKEGIKRCEEDTLYAIASRLERKTHIKAIVNP